RPALMTLLRVGFTEPPRSPGALVVSYTTVSPLPGRDQAVCFLWHCPAGCPGLPLTTTLPCGARTFLANPEGLTRPPGRLIRRAPIVRKSHAPREGRTPTLGHTRQSPALSACMWCLQLENTGKPGPRQPA